MQSLISPWPCVALGPIVIYILPSYFIFCPHCHVPGSSGASSFHHMPILSLDYLIVVTGLCITPFRTDEFCVWPCTFDLLLETRNRSRSMLLLFKLVCPSKYWLAKAVVELSYTFNHSSIWGFQMFVPIVFYFNLKTFSIQTWLNGKWCWWWWYPTAKSINVIQKGCVCVMHPDTAEVYIWGEVYFWASMCCGRASHWVWLGGKWAWVAVGVGGLIKDVQDWHGWAKLYTFVMLVLETLNVSYMLVASTLKHDICSNNRKYGIKIHGFLCEITQK
jgi:hypothetical protein